MLTSSKLCKLLKANRTKQHTQNRTDNHKSVFEPSKCGSVITSAPGYMAIKALINLEQLA